MAGIIANVDGDIQKLDGPVIEHDDQLSLFGGVDFGALVLIVRILLRQGHVSSRLMITALRYI